MNSNVKPLIFWEGFPPCGLIIRKVIREYGPDIKILGTKAAVPYSEIENELGHPIEWLTNPNEIWNKRQKYTDRNLIIHTGWNHSSWLKFGRYMRGKNGAKVVIAADNRFKCNLRQLFGAVWFRTVIKPNIDAVIVPGRQGQKLLSFLGMPRHRVYTGYYGAYEGIYHTDDTNNRSDEFLYVGQLVKRKSVDILVKGYKKYRQNGGQWSLRVVGDGPLKGICKGDGIIKEGFLQPRQVAAKMRNAKCLVLVSRDDHWGTALCEAAACGMLLITSRTVGASHDLLRQNLNGVGLDSISVDYMTDAYEYISSLGHDSLTAGSSVSESIAKGYDSNSYYAMFRKVCHDLFAT